MCSECGRVIGHHHMCPNAGDPELVKVGECEVCGKDIMTGEEMVSDGDYLYHYDCLSGLTVRELLDVLDITVSIAECE